MRIFVKTVLASFFLVFFSSLSIASEDIQVTVEELQYNSDKQESIASPTAPSLKWEQYLLNGNINVGTNIRDDGRIFLIAYGEQIVGKPINSSGFMDSRTIAYNKALLAAKSELAEALKVELESSRSLTVTEFGNETPSRLKDEIEPLSIMEKAATLTGLELDNEIKKFDPEWDGTNKTDNERIAKMAESREIYIENLVSKSRLFLQGATPIFNAEGPNENGKYVVAVGIYWSGKSTLVAESVYNPTVAPPQGKKNALTIKNQLDNLSDEDLAATLGVRIWWDEEGLPVIVSFAQAKGTGSTIIAKKKTAQRARHQIAQFVAENIVAKTSQAGGEVLDNFVEGSHESSDIEEFKLEISSRANKIELLGLRTILYKNITHPITDKRIVVNVITFETESSKLARGLMKMTDDQATKMDATKSGTVFKNNQESSDNSNSVGTVTTTGLQGVSSDPDDF